MRPVELEMLVNRELYEKVVLERLCAARESVLIATAKLLCREAPLTGSRMRADARL